MADEFIVECFHPYEAEKDDELSLQVGERLRVSDKSDPGWWIGERLKDGQSGWFPSNFVNPVEASSSSEASASTPAPNADAAPAATEDQHAAALTTTTTNAAQDTPAPAEDASATSNDTGPILARVEYDYEPKEPGELSLEAGRVITVLDKSDAAWWSGDCNGKIGVFPSNYVKLIERDESSSADKAHKFRLAAFGVKQGGLGSLFAGGVVPGLKKTGGLRKTGIDVTSSKRTSIDEPRSPVAATPPALPKAAPPAQPAAIATAAAAAHAHAHAPVPAQALPPAPVPVQEPVAAPAPTPDAAPVAPSPPVEAPSPSATEPRVPSRAKKPKAKQTKALVMYDYAAQEDDEISLVKGATIVVTDRLGDEGWWTGRDEQGNVGNFPSDFVELIKEEASEPSTPALPASVVPLPAPIAAAAPVPTAAHVESSPKATSPPPLPLHVPVPRPVSAQPIALPSPTESHRPELPRTRTSDSTRAVPPPIPKTSRPQSMVVVSPPPSSPHLVEQRPLHEAPPPLPSSPPPKRMSISSRSNSMDQAGATASSPRVTSRPPSIHLPAVPSPEPSTDSLSRSNTLGRHQKPIPEAPVEEEEQQQDDETLPHTDSSTNASNRNSYILPSPVARSRPLPPLARPPSIHQENRRSVVLPVIPDETQEAHYDLQRLPEEEETAAATPTEIQPAHSESVLEDHHEEQRDPAGDIEHQIKEAVPEKIDQEEDKEEHEPTAASRETAVESNAEEVQEEEPEKIKGEEVSHIDTVTSVNTEVEIETEPTPASEPEKPALPDISASGPSLSHASRPRPAKGRKLPSVPIPSQEDSFSAQLEADVKAAPIPEEPKKEEEASTAAGVSEKPGPPPKPIKPIFSKFPTPFAGAQPAAVALRPTGRRTESNESHSTAGSPPVSAVSPSSSSISSAAPAATPPAGGVKSLSSRFNQFQGVPSGGNTGHLELELAKLKRIMNEELDRIRRELAEEREKREQLEAEVKGLKQQLSSA